MLNDLMRHCLISANDEYPDLSFEDTVFEGFKEYVILTGQPLEVETEEEGLELLTEARVFVLDCVLLNMVVKGIIEISGMDEDGDLYYELLG